MAFADFELSPSAPANGGDGTNRLRRQWDQGLRKLGYPTAVPGRWAMSTMTALMILTLAARNPTAARRRPGVRRLRPRGGGFPAELDLTMLDGTTGYVIDGVFSRG